MPHLKSKGFRALRILVGFIPAEEQKPGAAAPRSPRRGIFVYLETVQGKVTPDNVFANTWLAKAACRGKTLDEPGVEEALKSYLVSRVVEERILEDAVEDREHGGPSRMIAEELNNGHLTERMEKDGVFRRMIREQGDQPVDPEEFFSEYWRRVEQREAELNHPLAKLEGGAPGADPGLRAKAHHQGLPPGRHAPERAG